MMEYYSTTEKNKLLIYETVAFKNIMSSKASQMEKNTHYLILYMMF